MKIILASVPLTGHLNPVLSIGRVLVEEGHEVVGLGPKVFRERIEQIGATFRAFSGDADLDLRDFAAAYPEFQTMAPGVEMTRFYFERVFADPLLDQYKSIQETLNSFSADLIVADVLFLGVLPMLLNRTATRPAVLFVSSTYLLWHREDMAPCNMGLPPAAPGAYEPFATEMNRSFMAPFMKYLNLKLTGSGFQPLEVNILDAVYALPDACLQLTIPSLEFPRPDLPSSLRFVGIMPILPNQAPLPPWASELEGQRKVVFVTQGTLSNHDFGQLILPTIEALGSEPDVLVVVSTGGRPSSDLPSPLPNNVRVATYLPYEWLLPKVDVFVTNGGYGTVNQALSQGVPLVTAGLTEDKADVNARVQWSGAGIDLGTNSPSSKELHEAIMSVLNNETYRIRAAELAAEFGEINTRGEILNVVDQLVATRSVATASV
jgi:MGT family glycosyltransferase